MECFSVYLDPQQLLQQIRLRGRVLIAVEAVAADTSSSTLSAGHKAANMPEDWP